MLNFESFFKLACGIGCAFIILKFFLQYFCAGKKNRRLSAIPQNESSDSDFSYDFFNENADQYSQNDSDDNFTNPGVFEYEESLRVDID